MTYRTLLVVAVLAVAAQAQAASITLANLWAFPATSFTMGTAGGLVVNALAADRQLPGFASLDVDLPDDLADGFVFGGLGLGGVCPGNCGWYGQGDLWPGDRVSDGTIIHVLWPMTDGTIGQIARATYHGGRAPVSRVAQASTVAITDSGGSWVLLLIGATLIGIGLRARSARLRG